MYDNVKLEFKGDQVFSCFYCSLSCNAVFLMQKGALWAHLTCNKILFLASEETSQNVTLIRTIVFSLVTTTGQRDKEMSQLCASGSKVTFL